MVYKKVETIIDTTFDGKKIVEVVLTGVDLTAGVKEITLDKIGKISGFVGGAIADTETDDYVKSIDTAVSAVHPNNGLSINAKKMQVSATNTWGAALTADIAGTVFRYLVWGI
jgi:hypothetical protein